MRFCVQWARKCLSPSLFYPDHISHLISCRAIEQDITAAFHNSLTTEYGQIKLRKLSLKSKIYKKWNIFRNILLSFLLLVIILLLPSLTEYVLCL
nr:MAG TPA: hypothetical protein [Caudoviricetes sp.]